MNPKWEVDQETGEILIDGPFTIVGNRIFGDQRVDKHALLVYVVYMAWKAQTCNPS